MLWLFAFLSGIGIGASIVWFLLRKDLKTLNTQTEALAVSKAQLAQLEKTESAFESLQTAHQALTETHAELKAQLGFEQKQAKEKIELLNQAREQLSLEFQNLANKIFEEKSAKFTDQNKTNIHNMVTPLKEQILEFKKKVEDVYDKESKDRVSLFNEIVNLKSLNQRMSEEALNLTNALKGQNKTQGTWGEMILERVLESSGLQKGREYFTQQSMTDEQGRRYQPDVVVQLPEGKDVVIDAKVSLSAYERLCNAEDEAARDAAMKQHILSIKTHIKGLDGKDYHELEGLRSLDFVLLFIPIEAAFLIALEHDQHLFDEAFSKNIMLVSPSTLLVTLRTIQNLWRYEYQNQNAQKIAKQSGDLYDKFVGFVEELERIGDYLDKAQGAYETAHKRLSTGKGNLIKRSQDLQALGIVHKKQLPEMERKA